VVDPVTSAATNETATATPPPSAADSSVGRTWSLWAAIGYGLLLLLAAVAVAARIPSLRDALDLSRAFQ
jgi:hypothetical protein